MLQVVGILLLCMSTFAFADDEERVPSACEMDRARRLNATATTPSILHLIPECEENGDYAALQCFTGNDWCVCYRRNGENINTPSKSIKACDCIRARDDAKTAATDGCTCSTNAPGVFPAVGSCDELGEETWAPRCTKDGYYRPKQCRDGECWCVDKNGKILGDPQTGDVQC